jgi:hypothetical protein
MIACTAKVKCAQFSHSKDSAVYFISCHTYSAVNDQCNLVCCHSKVLVVVNYITVKKKTRDNKMQQQQQTNNNRSLFDAFFIISKDCSIIAQYPSDIETPIVNSISNFCFPDGWEHISHIESYDTSYTFTLQSSTGLRKYGNCHHVVNPTTNTHECYCILSQYPYFTMLNHILLICFTRRRVCDNFEQSVFPFLERVLRSPFPFPGEKFSVVVDTHDSFLDRTHYLTRPDDDSLSFVDVDVKLLFSIFQDTKQILQIFNAALCEQRIVFVGDNINTVSLCCHSLCALLYPFTWQHIYIPVLPGKLLSYVCAPMPFIVGIHSSMLKEVKSLPTERLVIVNLVGRTVEYWNPPNDRHFNDLDEQPFQFEYNDALFNHLYSEIESVRALYETDQRRTRAMTYTEAITDKFLDFFVSIFGRYRLFCQEPSYTVDYDMLVEDLLDGLHSKDPSDVKKKNAMRSFVRSLQGSQMLEMFLMERAKVFSENGRNLASGEFEFRCSKLVPYAYGLGLTQDVPHVVEKKSNTSPPSTPVTPILPRALVDNLNKTTASVNTMIKNTTNQVIGNVNQTVAVADAKTSGVLMSTFSSLKSKFFGSGGSSGKKTGVKISAPKTSTDKYSNAGTIGVVDDEFGATDSLLHVRDKFLTEDSVTAKNIDEILHLNEIDLKKPRNFGPEFSFDDHHRLVAPHLNVPSEHQDMLLSFSPPKSDQSQQQTNNNGYIEKKKNNEALSFFDDEVPQQQQKKPDLLFDFEPDPFTDLDTSTIQPTTTTTGTSSFDPFATPAKQKQQVNAFDDDPWDTPF